MDLRRRAERLKREAVCNGECLICMLTPSQVYANVKGYGKAHRLMWEAHVGPIPPGMFVCHSCDTPRCINLDHLFLGTPQDNMTDKVNKNRQTYGGPPLLIDKDKLQEVRDLRAQGFTFEEIGVALLVNRRTVARFLGRYEDEC